jgi:predicted RecA/RadA family phage recombinase
MAEATFRKGNYRTATHVAAANITAGDVVLLGNTAGLANGIAHHDITNSASGTLAIGGGVYEVINRNNSATGATVYWDTTNNWVTSVSANMSLFGYISENGAGGTNSLCLVLHEPYYPPA